MARVGRTLLFIFWAVMNILPLTPCYASGSGGGAGGGQGPEQGRNLYMLFGAKPTFEYWLGELRKGAKPYTDKETQAFRNLQRINVLIDGGVPEETDFQDDGEALKNFRIAISYFFSKDVVRLLDPEFADVVSAYPPWRVRSLMGTASSNRTAGVAELYIFRQLLFDEPFSPNKVRLARRMLEVHLAFRHSPAEVFLDVMEEVVAANFGSDMGIEEIRGPMHVYLAGFKERPYLKHFPQLLRRAQALHAKTGPAYLTCIELLRKVGDLFRPKK